MADPGRAIAVWSQAITTPQIIITLSSLLLVCGCSAESPQQIRVAPVGPSLFLPVKTLEIGDIPATGVPQEFSMELRNTGDAELEIRELRPSCTCMNVRVEDTLVAPGDVTRLFVEIRPSIEESKTASVVIESNDPVRGQHRVTLSWKALTPISLETTQLHLGRLPFNSEIVKQIAIRKRPELPGGSTCSVGAVHLGQCTGSDQPSIQMAGDESDVISLRLRTGDVACAGHATIIVPLVGCWRNELTMTVDWEVGPFVNVQPSRLFLGSGRAGESLRGQLTVSAGKSQTIDVVDSVFETSQGEFKVTPVQSDSEILTLLVDAVLPEKPFTRNGSQYLTAELVLTLQEPQPETIRIPVSAIVRGNYDADSAK